MPSIRARAPTRRVAGGADRRRADAAAPVKPTMVRRCSSSNVRPATSRTIQAGSARSVAVQDRRQAGRQSGRLPHSAGFVKADFAWDDARLDAWLANPEAIIPGDIVAYRQPKAETRAAIIAYLKELN